jgi:hypothetical protein
MTEKHDRQYEKLLRVLDDPEKKSELHDDPDVGHILKKLSVNDILELKAISNAKSASKTCPAGSGDA